MPNESLQSVILDQIVATLGGAQQQVFDTRLTDFGPEELPADNVFPDTETPAQDTTGDLELTARIFIRHIAQAPQDPTVSIRRAIETRYVRAHQLLMADRTLNGTVKVIHYRGRRWEMEKGELNTIACVATYEVEFSTSITDPSQPGF